MILPVKRLRSKKSFNFKLNENDELRFVVFLCPIIVVGISVFTAAARKNSKTLSKPSTNRKNKKINEKMRVCAQNRKFAHENQSLHTRVQILHDQKFVVS